MIIAAGWWSEHWSEVAAVVLVASFVGLVGQAVRSSLFLGRDAVSRRARKRAAAANGTAASTDELRVAVGRLERRVSQLESRLPVARPGATQPTLIEETVSLEQRIESLASKGMLAPEIARLVDEPTGRVELILNLRRAASRA